MPEFTLLSHIGIRRPMYGLMLTAYKDYLTDSAPCKAGIRNQCAVRMSTALVRCGFSLEAFEPQNRVHQGRKACQLALPHLVGAAELAVYLTKVLGEPVKFQGQALKDARASLRGRVGVIYFNNCFRREKGGPQTGDHIDLWDGEHYYNQVLYVGAGGDAGASAPLFGRADAVWFFPLY